MDFRVWSGVKDGPLPFSQLSLSWCSLSRGFLFLADWIQLKGRQRRIPWRNKVRLGLGQDGSGKPGRHFWQLHGAWEFT
jgi:hypothetical protein